MPFVSCCVPSCVVRACLAQVGSRRWRRGSTCPSTGEALLRNALSAQIMNGEEAAALDAITRKAWQGRLRHRGHIEDVEVWPPEHDARHLLHRHLDDAVDRAFRRVADDPSVIDERVPYAAFGIDRRAIGRPAARRV